MSSNVNETVLGSAQSAEQSVQSLFALQRVYLKDVSVELPNAPEIFLEQQSPAIEVAVDVVAHRLSEEIFECEVLVTVTAKMAEKVAFLVEVKQAGIFQIAHVPQEQLDPILGIVCPNIVYPYLRVNVADLITRTGFAPIHLNDINFENFYQQRLAALQAQQQAAAVSESGLVLNA